MRWFWIDRFVEFESGHRAVAVKNVTLAEEHVLDYLLGYPILPPSLIVEGLAQTGGLLVSQHGDFLERVVLAKVNIDQSYRARRLTLSLRPKPLQSIHEHQALIEALRRAQVEADLRCF